MPEKYVYKNAFARFTLIGKNNLVIKSDCKKSRGSNLKNFSDSLNILIIDDHPMSRLGLRTALEAHNSNFHLEVADNGENGLRLAEKIKPDIVIVNLDASCFKGIATVKAIKAFDPDIKVVFLTGSNNEEEVIEALNAGAQAYCLKNMTPEKLSQVLNFINDGSLWFDPSVAENIRGILLHGKPVSRTHMLSMPVDRENNGNPQLTERELDVLKLIVDGFSNAEISEKLCVSIHTSKAHVCNILHKLSVEDRTQAAIKALKDGII